MERCPQMEGRPFCTRCGHDVLLHLGARDLLEVDHHVAQEGDVLDAVAETVQVNARGGLSLARLFEDHVPHALELVR